jgi:hypothetical protein
LPSLSAQHTHELATLGREINIAFSRLVDTETQPLPHDFESWFRLVHNERAKLEREAKALRVQRWRERVTSSLLLACHWVKDSPTHLTVLDGPEGLCIHPDDLVGEVARRAAAQFQQQPPLANRKTFFERYGSVIQAVPAEIPALTGPALKKFACRKLHGAAGPDGWSAQELALLPSSGWDCLAEVCNLVESVGHWPPALTNCLLVGLQKPVPTPATGIKLRMLRILPQILRAWSSTRSSQLMDWCLQWAPEELYGANAPKG